MARDEFEDAVRDALDEIPPELARVMDNVVVLVEDHAPPDEPDLLGLYEGTPLTERTSFWAARSGGTRSSPSRTASSNSSRVISTTGPSCPAVHWPTSSSPHRLAA